jgi:predicted nucleic acid-binding protein
VTAVLDASALAELVMNTPRAAAVDRRLAGHAGDLHLPHLALVETASILRGWARSDQIPVPRAAAALEDLAAFPARRWAVDDLLPRIWSLRESLTAYDATYVALAESLDATLVTCDARLRRGASGHSSVDIVVP